MTKKPSDAPPQNPRPSRRDINPLLSTIPMDLGEYYADLAQRLAQENADLAQENADLSQENTAPNSANSANSIDNPIDDDDDDAPTVYNVDLIAQFRASPPPHAPHEHALYNDNNNSIQQEHAPYNDDNPIQHEHALYNDDNVQTDNTPYHSDAHVAALFTDSSLMPFLTPTSPNPLPFARPVPPTQQPAPPETVFAQTSASPFESAPFANAPAHHPPATDSFSPSSSLSLALYPPDPTETPTLNEEEEDDDDGVSLFGMSTMGGYLAKLFGVGKIGEFLRGLAIFSGMGRSSLMRLSQKVKVQKYDPNEVIVRRGEQGDSMFILAQGDVQVLLRGGIGDALRIIPLHVGEVFGEMGLLTGNPRSADIVSLSKSVCLEIQKRDVEALCAQHPPMARFLTAILGQRLRSSKAITTVGNSRILREIGAGATAFVYAAQLQDTGQPVALKMLSHELAYDSSFRKRFLDEARILAQLQHPHIVRLYGTEEAYATVFLIMEMVEGSNLDTLLEKYTRFSYDDVRRILFETASALHHAHEHGIVHRDVKPANLLMNRQGHIKVTDFGLAVQPTKDKEEQSTQKPEGSPSYMAPEQIMWQPVDPRADIYALGIAAFKMLTGVLPFQGSIEQIFQQHVTAPLPDLRAYDPAIPQRLIEIIQKATAKTKEARFPSCRELLHALS